MQQIEQFLLKNGFEKKKENLSLIRYEKNKCVVTSRKIYRPYIIVDKTDEKYWSKTSNDSDIYWLIGVLTYHGLIDKNYKT